MALAALLAAFLAFGAWARWAGFNEGWEDGWTRGIMEDRDEWVVNSDHA